MTATAEHTHLHTDTFPAPLARRRRPTRVVAVGSVLVGGDEPIRVQSMLTADTKDVDAVLAEMGGLVATGCEIVRLTVPTRKDLEALPEIRTRMAATGLRVPLVADIHFNPALALGAVPHVEKVRINPGNYVDQKRFHVREYSDAQYGDELARVEDALSPLVAALREHGRSLRIGVNHGSLSDRVLNRYGDTPRGMVECAMEYLRILARMGFHETIVSMKASNPRVAIQAYRALAQAMDAEGMDYPLHLGVTEAGGGKEGRIKSAIGIGSLLCDGLGDTIRVSLTEAAANEIPAARELVSAVEGLRGGPAWPGMSLPLPQSFSRRPTAAVALPSGNRSIAVGGEAQAAFLGWGKPPAGLDIPVASSPFDGWLASGGDGGARMAPLASWNEGAADPPVAVLLEVEELESPALAVLLKDDRPKLLVLRGERLCFPVRRLVLLLEEAGRPWPVGVVLPAGEDGALTLGAAAEVGSLATDGLLDALIVFAQGAEGQTGDGAALAEGGQILLQGARLRTYRAEYISCPSCGRTLFDLEETTARIQARTAHLTGIRIGIMGCIVNGPGEMADADFGYVGGSPGKVNLYKGQDCLVRGVPADEAVERLVELLQEHGAWVEPGQG